MASFSDMNLEKSLQSSTNNQNVAFGLFNKLEDQYQTKLDHLSAQQTLLKNYQEISLYDKNRIHNMEKVEQENREDTINRRLSMHEVDSRGRNTYYKMLKIILLLLGIASIVLLIVKNR